ncbi:B12-binding domain-containing radical SAM protein [Pseudovibrio denitrificans]|uniref:B12-binding domain-containing radical SAM protein n=1 Tax=Pseudovibrio denitrificans TaxID=258256 RepID=UPI0039BEE9BD
MKIELNSNKASVCIVHPFLMEARNKNRLRFKESLALGYLAAALRRAGFLCDTINAEMRSLSTNQVADIIVANPELKLVGLSCKSQRTFQAASEIARQIKASRPDIHITIGGVLATAADEQVLQQVPHFDSVVRGEGEEAIVELAERIIRDQPLSGILGLTYRESGELCRSPARSRIRDLDRIAFPARDDLEMALVEGGEAEASAYMVSSRGCYAACTFCSIHQIYGDRLVVRRSPGNVVEEMERIVKDYGIRRFSFVDDIFLTPSVRGFRWINDFCDLLIEKNLQINFYAEMRADTLNQELLAKLRRAGMHRVFIGFEAGVDSVLKRWDKDCTVAQNDVAIVELLKSEFQFYEINMGYIMFDPEMTYSELKEQYYWLKNTGLAKVQHLQNKMNIYWGTPHYDRMVSQNRINDASFGDRWVYDCDDQRVDFVEKTLRTFHAEYDNHLSEQVLAAKEKFRSFVKVHDELAVQQSWKIEIIRQMHRRLEWAERALYYAVFEYSFRQIDANSEAALSDPKIFASGIVDMLSPHIESIQFESRLLSMTIDKLVLLKDVEDTQCSNVSNSISRSAEDMQAHVLIGAESVLIRTKMGQPERDRYEHSCEIYLGGPEQWVLYPEVVPLDIVASELPDEIGIVHYDFTS